MTPHDLPDVLQAALGDGFRGAAAPRRMDMKGSVEVVDSDLLRKDHEGPPPERPSLPEFNPAEEVPASGHGTWIILRAYGRPRI